MFIAMNRFKIRPGREAHFEDQWRTRETYLKGVDGFVAFALLRGQPIPGHGAPEAGAHEGHEHGSHGHDDHGHSHEAHDSHGHDHDHASHDSHGHEGHEHHEDEAHGHEHDHAAHGHDEHAHEAEPVYTDYISHTTWRDQSAFDAWRNSDVFRQAHAQGSVEGVLMGPPQVGLYASVIEEVGEPAKA